MFMVQGVDTVEGYFPQGVWYNISEVEAVDASTAGRRVRIAAPLETVPVHVLGGSIIPLQVSLSVSALPWLHTRNRTAAC